eukprot:3937831-Rhodomonas_salina.1
MGCGSSTGKGVTGPTGTNGGKPNLTDKYELGKALGTGSFATCRIGTLKSDMTQRFAVSENPIPSSSLRRVGWGALACNIGSSCLSGADQNAAAVARELRLRFAAGEPTALSFTAAVLP